MFCISVWCGLVYGLVASVSIRVLIVGTHFVDFQFALYLASTRLQLMIVEESRISNIRITSMVTVCVNFRINYHSI